MGLETPNAGPIPCDMFIGWGWAEDFVWEGADLSGVEVAMLGLTRVGRPSDHYMLTLADGELELAYVPPEGEEATGLEPPNAVLARIAGPIYASDGTTIVTPAGNANWVAGRYRFVIGLSPNDGTPVDPVLEGLIEIRSPG